MDRPTNPAGERLVANSQNDEIVIDLTELARHLWARKKLILAAALLGALIMGGISLSMRNVYESKVLLAPAQDEKGGLSALAGQFGGLASLAGIELGGSDQLVIEGIALLTSREFLLEFIRDNNIKPKIFDKEWNTEKKQWNNPSFITRTIQKAKEFFTEEPDLSRFSNPNEPTDSETYERFSNQFISVKQDKKTSLITVSIRSYSASDAMHWANQLVTRANERLRQAKKTEAERSIAYLQKVSAETSVIEMQRATYQLIEAQTKTIMLANAKTEFAFKTIDPAFYPDEKVSPRRSLMLIGGAILGSLVTFCFAFAASIKRTA